MAQTAEGVKKIKKKYGRKAYQDWGKKGGNPVLIEQSKRKVRILPRVRVPRITPRVGRLR